MAVRHTTSIRHLELAVDALVAMGCDAVDTTSTAHATSTTPTPQTASRSPNDVDLRAERMSGGGGVAISVYDRGAPGTRPIVFIHGFSQSFLTWDDQFRELAPSFHIVAYDLRGHGASEKPLDPALYTESLPWAEDLAAVIRAKNLQRPVLVGWSYGGYVIADFVRRFGDGGLGGIVFLAAVTKNGTEEATAFLSQEVLSVFADILSPDVRNSIDGTRALASMFSKRGSDEWEVAVASAMMVPASVRLAMFSRLLDNDDVLASIRVPTLVVHGAGDRVVKQSAAEHIARTVPGAKLLVYPGAGHAPHLENGPRFNRDLAEFVRSIR